MDETNDSSKTPSESSGNDNKELLVHIDCNSGLIMDYIRENAHLETSTEFDLWEESTSVLKNISSRKPHISGLEVFLPNHTYFLVVVERDNNGQIVNYVPMITGRHSRALSEVIAKIRRLSKRNSLTTISSSKIQDKGGRKKSQGKSK